MSEARTAIVDVDLHAIDGLLERSRALLSPADHALCNDLCQSLISLQKLVRERGTTIARLRRLFGLSGCEKTASVLGTSGAAAISAGNSEGSPPPSTSADSCDDAAESPTGDDDVQPPVADDEKPKGHGRLAVSDFAHATHVTVCHHHLRAGHSCPECDKGTLYLLKEPARFLRIIGQAPLTAICWDCERLRCSGCGKVYTARAPPEAQGPKYTETAASMMALLRYGTGTPLNRLEHLQQHLGTPVPASTQWEVVEERVEMLRPVYNELLRLAAQGTIVHNDDTYVRILEFMGKRRAELLANAELADPERTGLYTTAVVSIAQQKTIALFFTGRKHAGENLTALFEQRVAGLPPPLLMSDALDRNVPKGVAVDWANCLAHARRGLVDEVENFPIECEHILEALGLVFAVDAHCKKDGCSDAERLSIHQRDSGPLMAELELWMRALVEEKRIEPNSGMGEAVNYMLKRWDRWTRFLHVPGAPLENNICERALKKAIRQRNNSLFYKTLHGAKVGDVYMTLIHTTELHDGNPFDYLTALQLNVKAVAERPADWLPWNYLAAVSALAPSPHP